MAPVPGKVIPYKMQRQRLANELPSGEELLVLLARNRSLQKLSEQVAMAFIAKGHPVTALPAGRLADIRLVICIETEKYTPSSAKTVLIPV